VAPLWHVVWRNGIDWSNIFSPASKSQPLVL
jgi:hypothetical protein